MSKVEKNVWAVFGGYWCKVLRCVRFSFCGVDEARMWLNGSWVWFSLVAGGLLVFVVSLFVVVDVTLSCVTCFLSLMNRACCSVICCFCSSCTDAVVLLVYFLYPLSLLCRCGCCSRCGGCCCCCLVTVRGFVVAAGVVS